MSDKVFRIIKNNSYWIFTFCVIVTTSITTDYCVKYLSTNKIENKIENKKLPQIYYEEIKNYLLVAKHNHKNYGLVLKRFNSIDSIIYKKDSEMPKGVLAYVDYKIVNNVLLPSVICFSDAIDFEYYGRRYVMFHELGHALLMIDDCRDKFDGQIMWHKGLVTYINYSDNNYLFEKVIEQFNTPETINIESFKHKKLCKE